MRGALATGSATRGYELPGAQMVAAVASTPSGARIRAIGEAYVGFALDEPHLFHLTFQADPIDLDDPDLLSTSEPLLADTVRPSRAKPDAQNDAAILSRTIVHGLSSLAIDGQLDHRLPRGPGGRRRTLMRIMGRAAPLFTA